jgi:hypothetical protein
MEETLTEANVQQFYGILPKNFNAIITCEKKTVTTFDSTIRLRANAFGFD